MLLDFFATFFSSASALLPIFAQDVLRVGARGYGWLYAAPAVGAVLMSAVMIPLTSRIKRRGPVLLWAIGGYGLATAVFGISRWFWLTFFCLAMTGAMDTISMIIRNIVRQLETPDRLRGRMIGVNMVFFQGGPQLGELEAGFVANWLGPVVSVVSGGVGCLIATAWVAATTPALRHYHVGTAERTLREVGKLKVRDFVICSGCSGANSIEISGSSVIFTPGMLLTSSLVSSGVFALCSFLARSGSAPALSMSRSTSVTRLPSTNGLRRLHEPAFGLDRDRQPRAGEQLLHHGDLLERRRLRVAVRDRWERSPAEAPGCAGSRCRPACGRSRR